MKTPKKEFFDVIRLHRDDLRACGYNADNVSDEDMEKLAEEISEAIGNDIFSDVVSDWCAEKGLLESSD